LQLEVVDRNNNAAAFSFESRKAIPIFSRFINGFADLCDTHAPSYDINALANLKTTSTEVQER